VSLHRVSIRGNRVSVYAKKQFAKEVEAEIDLPSALEAGDFVKGRLTDLTIPQLQVISCMRDGNLYIEGRGYRIVSLDESGDFVALKDTST
jgi:hypothetical protein